MRRYLAFGLLALTAIFASQCTAQAARAKNSIVFLGDGAGVSSLNAASVYGYNRPQAFFTQSLPGVALADTSTATQWVTDGSAGATAIATGMKTRNASMHSLRKDRSAGPGTRLCSCGASTCISECSRLRAAVFRFYRNSSDTLAS